MTQFNDLYVSLEYKNADQDSGYIRLVADDAAKVLKYAFDLQSKRFESTEEAANLWFEPVQLKQEVIEKIKDQVGNRLVSFKVNRNKDNLYLFDKINYLLDKKKERNQRVKHIIFLNAPPRAGKDTVANILTKYLGKQAAYVMFKDKLYSDTSELLDMDKAEWAKICMDGNTKDAPFFNAQHLVKLQEKLNGVCTIPQEAKIETPREMLIFLAEKVLKPLKGEDYIGVETCRTIDRKLALLDVSFVVVPDLGFDYELNNKAANKFKYLGYEVSVVHINRHGCDYSKDSRNTVIPLPDQNYFVLDNNGSLADLEQQTLNLVLYLLNKR